MNKLLAACAIVLGLPLALADEIYQYQKADGTIVFTNKPVKNAKK
jgi:hypothetical protein